MVCHGLSLLLLHCLTLTRILKHTMQENQLALCPQLALTRPKSFQLYRLQMFLTFALWGREQSGSAP